MSRLCLLDFESTGLDPRTARPIEYCFHIWDITTGESQEIEGFLWDESYPELSEEIIDLTGITDRVLREKGGKPAVVLDRLAQTAMKLDFLVAHNAHGYDKVLLEAECARHGIALPKVSWIDTMTDLPYPQKMKCRKLSHLALEHGNTVDPKKLHGAKADVALMKSIMACYNLQDVARLCGSRRVVAKAQVSYQDKDLAKNRGYSWENVGALKFPKTWVKMIRESQWEEEEREAPFPISQVAID